MDKTKQAGLQMMESHKRTHAFTINMNGYNGDFTVKYPALIERMKIGTLRARYLGDVMDMVDVYTDNIAYMSATLETLLVNKPKWFNLEQLDDYGVLEAVFDEYMSWANSFRRSAEPSTYAQDSGAGTDEEALESNEDVPDANQR